MPRRNSGASRPLETPLKDAETAKAPNFQVLKTRKVVTQPRTTQQLLLEMFLQTRRMKKLRRPEDPGGWQPTQGATTPPSPSDLGLKVWFLFLNKRRSFGRSPHGLHGRPTRRSRGIDGPFALLQGRGVLSVEVYFHTFSGSSSS